MAQQAGPNNLRHHHVCYSPNCQPPPSHTSNSEGPLCFRGVGQCPCVACAVDANTCSGYTAVPVPGSPYHLEGFASGRLPDGYAQPYVGPVQRGYVDPAIPWASLPPGRSDMTRPFVSSYTSSQSMTVSASQVPAAADAYTAIDSTYSSTLIVNPVPLRLEQGSTDPFIVAQTDYDCGQPFPTAALSPSCAYQTFSLSSANANNFDALSHPYEVAFPGVAFGQKISFRIRLVNCPQYDRQVTISSSCAGRSRSSPTRAALATLMAKEIKRFIDREKDNRRPLMIMHLGRALTLDDLCLVEIRHVSRASIQPVIGLVARL